MAGIQPSHRTLVGWPSFCPTDQPDRGTNSRTPSPVAGGLQVREEEYGEAELLRSSLFVIIF
jgi:hypothetical protein